MANPWELYADNVQTSAPWESYAEESAPVKLPKAKDFMKDPTEGKSQTDLLLAGVGKGMTDLARGAGQRLGLVSEQEVSANRKLDEPLMNRTAGKIGNFIGQVATTAPAMLVPGANTYAGAGLVGALSGAAQPTVEGESALLNTGMGALGGVAGQKLGNVIGNKITDKVARNAQLKVQNATKDEAVQMAKEAGYQIPRSLYNPSFFTDKLESIGGKAATLQKASANNQEITNTMAKKSIGIADDESLSIGAVESARKAAYKPYQEVASISKGASNALEELKQAKADANAWFASYNRSANPEHLAKAKEFDAIANTAEEVLKDYAKEAGKPNLVDELMKARKQIAKTYTVERALNRGTGDIDARVLGRLYQKGKPLSDGLETIGRFNASFPKASQPTQQSAGAGISALEPLSSAMYGTLGSLATGSPMGFAAAGMPLLRAPARSLALSQMLQKAPSYGGGLLNMSNLTAPYLPATGTVLGGLLGANSN